MLCSPSEAAFYARRLLSGYPNANPADPQFYLAGIVEILTRYELSIVKDACEGDIQIEQPTFLPTHGDITIFLAKKALSEHKTEHYAKLIQVEKTPIEFKPWDLFVPSEVPGYEKMVERAKDAKAGDYKFTDEFIVNQKGTNGGMVPGIWVPHQWWDEIRGLEPASGLQGE